MAIRPHHPPEKINMNPKYDLRLARKIADSENLPLSTVLRVLMAIRRLERRGGTQLDVAQLAGAILIEKPGTHLAESESHALSASHSKKPKLWNVAPTKIAGHQIGAGLHLSLGSNVCVVNTVSPKGFNVVKLSTKKPFTIQHVNIG